MWQNKFFLPFRQRERDVDGIPMSTSATQSEGIIIPIGRVESNSKSSSNNISSNHPVVREIPIRIVPAMGSHSQVPEPNYIASSASSSVEGIAVNNRNDKYAFRSFDE